MGGDREVDYGADFTGPINSSIHHPTGSIVHSTQVLNFGARGRLSLVAEPGTDCRTVQDLFVHVGTSARAWICQDKTQICL